MCKVSVIIPVYNTGEIIKETIASVRMQTFRDFEIIIVDDGSSDNTVELIDDQNDPAVRIIRQENTGIAGARNRGMAEAKGEYLAFLDHDDLFLPEKLQCQVELLDKDPELALVYSPVETFGNTDVKIPDYELISGDVFCSVLEQNKIHSASCIMIRRAAIEKYGIRFRQEFAPCDDWDFYLRLSHHCRFANTGNVLVRYRLHGGNESRDSEKMYKAGIRVLRQIIPVSAAEKRAWKHSLAKHCYGLAYLCARQKRYREFFCRNFQAVWTDWRELRAWSLFLRFPFMGEKK